MEKQQSTNQKKSTFVGIDPLQNAPQSGELTLVKNAISTEVEQAATGANPRASKWILWAGFIFAMLWSAGALAFVTGMTGFEQMANLPPGQISGLAFGTIGPALFIFALSWVIRELVLFAKTAASISTMAARFADPAKATQEDASAIASAVSQQMGNINKSVEGALARLAAMEEVLDHHAEAFAKAESNARSRTDELINDLRREREAVSDLADQLDHKAADIAATIAEQSKMVVSAADIANAQTIEGGKLLDLATEKLEKSASNAITGATRISARLDNSTEQLDSSSRAINEAHQQLSSSASLLENTREQTKTAMQSSKDEIRELLAASDKCVDQIKTAANDSARGMKQALEETIDQARHYTSIMREESKSLADSHQGRAKELQNAADEARSALDTYADVIAKRLEQANEASFSAASWADKTFDKLQEATNALDNSLQSLPKAADASAREVEKNLRDRLADLNQASRLASDEARGIDEAFQSRIRQNYELLSGFMLKMGATASPLSQDIDIPNPLKTQTNIAKEEKVVAETKLVVEEPTRPEEGIVEPIAKPTPTAETQQIIPDLDLKPENHPTPTSVTKEGWNWKDVLSRIDHSTPTAPDTQSATNATAVERLVSVFQSLDIQPDQLFDKTSYRAASLARITDGHQAMADVVRVDAIEAISSLSARFKDDPSLRQAAEDFTQELRDKVEQAATSGQKIHLEAHLRTGDGPAYLLLEAALLD